MFANKYYERDIQYAFAMNRLFLRVIGLWPLARSKSFFLDLIETVAVVFACSVLLLCEIIPSVLYMAMILSDIRTRLKVASCIILSTVTVLKYSSVLLYRSQVRSCLLMMDEDWRNVVDPKDRTSMINKVKIGKRLIVMCAIFVYMTGVAFRMILPLSMGKIVTPQNVTIRPLPCVAHLVILDVQRSPIYEIVYGLQFFAGFTKYTITLAAFGFVTICAMHFCAQSNILVTLMNDFVNETRPENLDKKLATVVNHQIKIRNFLQMVQTATQYPSLVEVLGSTVMICFAGYYMLLAWDAHSAVRLFSYGVIQVMLCFDLFIYCYMGEQVIEQGEKVALTACTLEWHHLPYKKARGLILLIAISETPLKLKAGNFIDLSVRTFSNVIKMAVTYLNLLRSMG
ncbi:PREDICTED: odorant receptor 85f-like isoform X2 [Vollenhovia emeryi]|uniref:odorant receptor 85f-like isoform X2 n=1 Tax=Vollenhovia emeryi TaxID=411798 RepID=UPI0005F4A790|nr:PREDICTED: odorant receptor 85f-like isoform X2 [Vollenhovia emeryi]